MAYQYPNPYGQLVAGAPPMQQLYPPTGNPFYIHPGGDITGGLSGLEKALLYRRGEEEVSGAEKEREEAIEAAKSAYASRDPDQIAQFNLEHPEMAQQVKLQDAVQYKNAVTRQNMLDTSYEFLADPTKENLIRLVSARKKVLNNEGVPPEEQANTDSLLEQFEKDPEGVIQRAHIKLAAIDTDRYTKWKEALTGKAGKKFAPSNLAKLIQERESLIQQGAGPDDPRVKAYDRKISGMDIDIDNMTPEEIKFWGANMNLTGKMPSLGRGKEAAKIRMEIAKSAARQALGADQDGVPEGKPTQTPAEAALEVIGTQADTKAIQGSLNFLDKQLSSMGSFVSNLSNQIDQVNNISKDLKTFDTRLLNVPLRKLRGRIKGSPLQAKYDLYLSEIESEIGKLATGSTASVAELSVGAQERWSKIHDKSLSIADMQELLKETKHAANIRLNSVQDQLNKTRERMRTRGYAPQQPTQQQQAPQSAIDYLMANPELKEAFRQKYGYIPEGI